MGRGRRRRSCFSEGGSDEFWVGQLPTTYLVCFYYGLVDGFFLFGLKNMSVGPSFLSCLASVIDDTPF
jgi:hypothetical protein